MNKNYFETIIGIIVVVITIMFFLNARNVAELTLAKNDSYQLQATFLSIDGVDIGSDVRISGIKIGSVTDIRLDSDSYDAILQVSISKEFNIPEDSYISIMSSGLLGGKYIDIEPGIADIFLQDGEDITYTRSSVSIENLLSKFLFKN
ncbi:MAG: outer membrane lipid asymmetry maintenance protein MlaD [Rickettsiales bacterium]|jgi:phospholipid/cholesterol/gamma-HCH transport system substrate-binding protein|nr:outer membrane lipid asymmetry maintenance protein MlaD [Rickettsiales bacterium]